MDRRNLDRSADMNTDDNDDYPGIAAVAPNVLTRRALYR